MTGRSDSTAEPQLSFSESAKGEAKFLMRLYPIANRVLVFWHCQKLFGEKAKTRNSVEARLRWNPCFFGSQTESEKASSGRKNLTSQAARVARERQFQCLICRKSRRGF